MSMFKENPKMSREQKTIIKTAGVASLIVVVLSFFMLMLGRCIG